MKRSVLCIALVACSSNATLPNGPVPMPVAESSVAVPLKVFIPNRIGGHRAEREHLTRRSNGRLHQLFIAANSAGIEVAVYPHGSRTKLITSFTGNISSSSPNCTPVKGGRSCSFKLAIRPGGPYDLLFATFDQPPVHGLIPNGANQLGAAITSAKIAKGKANALKVTVGGVVASTFLYAPQPTLFHAIASNTESLVAGAFDADGNVIASDGYVDANGKHLTITVSADANAGSTITLSPSKFSSAPLHGVTLTYSSLKATATQLQSGFSTVIATGTGTAAPSTLRLRVFEPTTPLVKAVDSGPEAIALLGNTIFVTAVVAGKVDYIINGVLHSFPADGPTGLAVDSEDNVWWTNCFGNSLGLAFPKSTGFAANDSVYAFPSNTAPNGIANGPDGALWVTEVLSNAIARVPISDTLVGTVTTYPLPTNGTPRGITVGPDGALWFAESNVGKIARIPVTATPGSSAQIREYSIPTTGGAHSSPFAVATSKDGALWFTDLSTPYSIRRMTTTGAVTTFLVPNGHRAREIAVAPDGALWFTEDLGDGIARLSPNASPSNPNIVEFGTYDSGASPYGIAVAPDGSVYYTEYGAGAIIQMQ